MDELIRFWQEAGYTVKRGEYSDFYVPCEDRLKHKGIRTVEIAVK